MIASLGKLTLDLIKRYSIHIMHCKKRLLIFLSPAGMSQTKLSPVGNNLINPDQGEFG
jgi:hypothetical protein